MSKQPIFALIDCNNFFASCERLFRPDLSNKPVVVLSSNDGCVVARSNEAKALGIPMGAPAFKYRDVFRQHDIAQFSANFALYGDISRRITSTLASVTPRLEIYSVDEAFLELQNLPIQDLSQWGAELRASILKWVGMPVSIGIATSKTLAKLASEQAKKVPELGGVLSLVDRPTDQYLQATDVQKVWGVGWRLGPKLRAEGIHNALSLARMPRRHAQQLMGIRGRQTVEELNGTACFPLELEHKPRQTIARTRTFGHDTNDLATLHSAIATFATQAAFRLRQDNQLTRHVGLFLTTNRKKPGYRTWQADITLTQPTADTSILLSALSKELNRIHLPAIPYHRAGVWLADFSPADRLQTDLLGTIDTEQHDISAHRMKTIDAINEKHGKSTVTYAATLLPNAWQPMQANKSPAYTTSWADLPVIEKFIW